MIFFVDLNEHSNADSTSARIDSFGKAEETVLIGLVRQGNREAFDEIDRRYRRKLCRFLARHTEGTQRAEELAQQALVKAFLAIETLQHNNRFGGWLYKIAFRLALDESRKNAKAETVFFDDLDERESRLMVDPRTVDPGTEPENDDSETTNNLWKIARQVLTPNEYAAVWLKYVDGYKVDSIAKIMRKTRISIRVLLFRARKKLLKALSPLR